MNKFRRCLAAILAVTLLMCLLCSCGNSSPNVLNIVKGYKKTLMRPETMIVRDGYFVEGDFNYRLMYEHNIQRDDFKDIHLLIIRYTCENAQGTVIEDYMIYDVNTEKYYAASELNPDGKMKNTEGTVYDHVAYKAINNSWSTILILFDDLTLTYLTDKEIDNVNAKISK